MKKSIRTWLRPLLFALGGGLAGLLYYHFFGCTTGCTITSNPVNSVIYMGLIGALLAGVTKKEG